MTKKEDLLEKFDEDVDKPYPDAKELTRIELEVIIDMRDALSDIAHYLRLHDNILQGR